MARGRRELADLERRAELERRALAQLDRRIDRLRGDLDDDDSAVRRTVYRELDRLEQERADQAAVLAGAEAQVAEWTAAPEVDHYQAVYELIHGRRPKPTRPPPSTWRYATCWRT